MESSMAKREEKEEQNVNYESYIVNRQLLDYWRAEEKVQLVALGIGGRIPITTLCKINSVTPSLYYEWRELFLAGARERLMGNKGRSQREAELERKLMIMERVIGNLTLEKELLKKIQEN